MLESSQCSKLSINSLLPEQNINSETHASLRRQHPKVFFVNGDGEVMSVYRSVLYSIQVKFLLFLEWHIIIVIMVTKFIFKEFS